MTDQGRKKEPVHKIQRGSIEAAVWENTTRTNGKAKAWYSVQIYRRYKTDQGEYRETNSYALSDFVFNLDQTDGLERPADDVPTANNSPLEEAQKIVDGMPNPPEIRYGASLNPCYNAARDVVLMPTMGQFEDGEHFFSTLHHELVHSTGAPGRLNRFEKREGGSR